jgi:hypothetical protein
MDVFAAVEIELWNIVNVGGDHLLKCLPMASSTQTSCRGVKNVHLHIVRKFGMHGDLTAICDVTRWCLHTEGT